MAKISWEYYEYDFDGETIGGIFIRIRMKDGTFYDQHFGQASGILDRFRDALKNITGKNIYMSEEQECDFGLYDTDTWNPIVLTEDQVFQLEISLQQYRYYQEDMHV